MIETLRIIAEKEAKKDYDEYKKGEITKEELLGGCQFARMCAAFGDEESQTLGYYYLVEMEKLRIIKNLHVED